MYNIISSHKNHTVCLDFFEVLSILPVMNILFRIILGIFICCMGICVSLPHTTFAQTSPKTEVIENYILEAYKLQGDKIITALVKNLEKIENVDRIKTYKNLQTTFILKKQSIQRNKKLSKMTQDIL